jgi:hypothetical protein
MSAATAHTRTILTPKRRKLTKAARRQIDDMVETWRRKSGAWSTNGMMGLSIRAGMVFKRITELAIAHDAVPMGVVKVPDLAPGIIPGSYILANGIDGFSVDLRDLWQLPGRFVNVAQPRCAIVIGRAAVGAGCGQG